MLATKIIIGIYSTTTSGIKYVYNFIIDTPAWYRQNLLKIKEYIEDFKYKIKNLREANFKLGLYHLGKLNLNDAIIRFKLIDKFFNKGDVQANYQLGWCYFLKNNFQKASRHLKKAGAADSAQLGAFIENYSTYSEIPAAILQQSRDFLVNSKSYFDRFQDDKLYLPTVFVQETLDKISDLPDDYEILEINSGVGLVGVEIRKRLPDYFKLTGIEVSNKMLEVARLNNEVYDELLNTSLTSFAQVSLKFDIILSLNGLISARDFKSYLGDVNLLLADGGYFAFCLVAPAKNFNPLKAKEYLYISDEIKEACELNNFILLGVNELKLGINNKYYIYIYRKKHE